MRKKRKLINNELTLIKIRNYENIIFKELLEYPYLFDEIYLTTEKIKSGKFNSSFLLKSFYRLEKKYEKSYLDRLFKKFIEKFEPLYLKYKELYNKEDVSITNLKKYKLERIKIKEKLIELLYSVNIDKKQLLKIIEKSNYLNIYPLDHINKLKEKIAYYKNILVYDNLYLVVYVAKLFGIKNNLEDIVNIGVQGVIKAINMVDITMNLKFSTYAYNWVQVYVREALLSDQKVIKVPLYLIKKIQKINTIETNYYKEFNQKISNEELSKKLGWSLDVINNLKASDNIKIDSINSLINDTENSFEIFFQDDKNLLDKSLEKDDMYKFLNKKLSFLSDLEKQFVINKYGLFGNTALSEKKLMNLLRVKKDRLYSLEVESLSKLKNNISEEEFKNLFFN